MTQVSSPSTESAIMMGGRVRRGAGLRSEARPAQVTTFEQATDLARKHGHRVGHERRHRPAQFLHQQARGVPWARDDRRARAPTPRKPPRRIDAESSSHRGRSIRARSFRLLARQSLRSWIESAQRAPGATRRVERCNDIQTTLCEGGFIQRPARKAKASLGQPAARSPRISLTRSAPSLFPPIRPKKRSRAQSPHSERGIRRRPPALARHFATRLFGWTGPVCTSRAYPQCSRPIRSPTAGVSNDSTWTPLARRTGWLSWPREPTCSISEENRRDPGPRPVDARGGDVERVAP